MNLRRGDRDFDSGIGQPCRHRLWARAIGVERVAGYEGGRHEPVVLRIHARGFGIETEQRAGRPPSLARTEVGVGGGGDYDWAFVLLAHDGECATGL